MHDVRELMDQSPARAKIMILDACHAGAPLGEKGMSSEFIRRVFAEARGMAVLASCTQGQQSWEWRDKRRSVFTHYLLEALTGRADLESGKGFVTIYDAHRYVTAGVKGWAVQRGLVQTPTLQYAGSGYIVLVQHTESLPEQGDKEHPSKVGHPLRDFIYFLAEKLKTSYIIFVVILLGIAIVLTSLLMKRGRTGVVGITPTPSIARETGSDVATEEALRIQEIWPKETACQLGGTWKATLRVAVRGGDGTYRYYHNGDRFLGPTPALEADLALIGEDGSPLQGKVKVESGGINASQNYTIAAPDCH